MTDEQLRALERRFQQTGALEDEVPFLRASLRAGELPRERLELAAYLGHAPSREVVPAPRLVEAREVDWTALERWGDGISRWGEEVSVRAAVAAARRVLPRWDWQQRTDDPTPQDIPGPQDFDDRPRLAIEAAESWLTQPSAQRVRAARAAVAEVWATLEGTFYVWVMEAAQAAASAGRIDPDPARDANGRVPLVECLRAAQASETSWRLHSDPDLIHAADARQQVREQVDRWLRAAVAAELVPWALGRGDPVADRRAPL